jgi:hypothetical protein
VLANPLPEWLETMLANPPTAGNGVHDWLFQTARQLHAHMGTVEIEKTLEARLEGCGRHVPMREIRDAIKNSSRCAWEPTGQTGVTQTPLPLRPEADTAQIDRIVRTGIGLYDFWECSPVRFDDADGPLQTEYVIDQLIPGNPLLCVGKSSSEFATRRREVWRGHLSQYQFIVPQPMTKVTGLTLDGRSSEHTKEATGPLTWLVCEFDFSKYARNGVTPTEWLPWIVGWEDEGISIADACSALLWALAALAPLVLVVSSGGKSLHGWFRIQGVTLGQLNKFTQRALTLGACSSTLRNPSQFVRMPDGTRDNGNRQLVWYFDPPNF